MEFAPLFPRDSIYEEHLTMAAEALPPHTLSDASATAVQNTSNLNRAMALVRDGRIEPFPDGKRWRVTGQTGVYVTRQTSCSCPQGRHKDWCYHRMGLHVYIQWCEQLALAGLDFPMGTFEVETANGPVEMTPTTQQPMPGKSGLVAALDRLVATATQKLPQCTAELIQGQLLVEVGGVELHDDHTATVWLDAETSDQTIDVNARCPNPGCEHVPQQWCRHRFAHALQRRLLEELAREERAEEAAHAAHVQATTPVVAHEDPQDEPQDDDQPSLPLSTPGATSLNQEPVSAVFQVPPVDPTAFTPVPSGEEDEDDVLDLDDDGSAEDGAETAPPPSPATPPATSTARVLGMRDLLQPLKPRPIAAIIADLSKPLPDACVAHRQQKGTNIPYLHHYVVLDMLDMYAPNWHGRVVKMEMLGSRLMVTYRLSIPCAEGVVVREDVGVENDWDEDEGARFGDPGSNAKAMALKRAAMQFGLGRWLYAGRDGTRPAFQQYTTQEKTALWKTLGLKVDALGWERDHVLAWLKQQTASQKTSDVPVSALLALLAQLAAMATEDD